MTDKGVATAENPAAIQDYPYRWSFTTRWNDNDIFGHLNNTIYYAAMDTAVTSWFVGRFGFDAARSPWIAVIVSSSCRFHTSAVFPDLIEVGVRAERIGRTSIVWRFGLFRQSDGTLLATGEFVHVIVERDTPGRPATIPAELRSALEQTMLAALPHSDTDL
jgi:acyl-CoA thioester hydrolase